MKMVKDLLNEGFVGECLIDKRVQIVKTHYPEKIGVTEFQSARVVLLTRNPLDTVVSLFNLMATGSHSNSILDKDYTLFAQDWKEFADLELNLWADYH